MADKRLAVMKWNEMWKGVSFKENRSLQSGKDEWQSVYLKTNVIIKQRKAKQS